MIKLIKNIFNREEKKPSPDPILNPLNIDLSKGDWEEYLLPADKQQDIKFTGKLLQTHLNTQLYITQSGKYITYIVRESGGSYCILECVTDIYQNGESHPCLFVPLLEKMDMIEFMGEYTDPFTTREYQSPEIAAFNIPLPRVPYKYMLYKVKYTDTKVFVLWGSKEHFVPEGYFLYAKPELFDLKDTKDLERWLRIHPLQTSKALRQLLDLDIKEIY